MTITIANPKKLEQLKSQIKKGGYQKLHVLADFDGTLTYGGIGQAKVPSILSVLRNGQHLTKDYPQKATKLFNHYHAIEIDSTIPIAQKKRAMQTWWKKHNRLLIASGLKKSDLKDIIQDERIQFRKGLAEFLDFLHHQKIPLIVVSASGCGEAIPLFFKKIKKDYPNIFFVINRFRWNKSGQAIGNREPIIHALNKDETIFKAIPQVAKAIGNRKNILLLGDSLGDLGMTQGSDYQNLISVGFLNFPSPESCQAYREQFDLMAQEDEDFTFINDLVKSLK